MIFKKNKEYYRLFELEKVCDIDHYDYLYFSEKFKDSINVYVHKLPVMITNQFWEDKIYCATAVYTGLISLTKKDKIKLLQNKKVTISNFQLEESEDIKSYSTDQPFLLDDNNDVVNQWEFVPQSGLVGAGVRATFLPTVRAINKTDPMIDLLQKKSLPRISKNSKEITFDDICVDPYQANLIASLLRIKIKENIQDSSGIKLKGNIEDELNLFQSYIIFLLKTFPNKGAADLWKMLNVEFEKDNDEIDPYSLLIEINVEQLIWINKEDVEKTVKKRSFETEVAKVKKILKNNKKK